jgi:D-methionine transport system substrate-binding protein
MLEITMIRKWLILSIIGLGLLGCEKPKEDALVVGTIAGPETELVEVAKTEAFKRHGLRIKIVEFSDYNLPNEALRDGSLDANAYQHKLYLDQAMLARGYPFEILGKTFIYPMGLYSSKHHSLQEMPAKPVIAIPNDPSNEARALKLLERNGWITLNPGPVPTVQDIVNNPNKIVFKPMDAAQLPRILPDVDGAVINTTFAVPSGLHPAKDALLLETKDSPYANLIVIRKDSKKKEQLKQFVEAFQSDAVKKKAHELFDDSALPGW